ncbi:MAG: lipoyl(octanoyl) transferase LipB [Planctomycetota bacterium]
MPELTVHDLGRTAYADALATQERLVERVGAGDRARLLLCEHDPPVITLGRSARREHLLLDEARLARRGVQVRQASRGGDVTWHGPGQLVAYLILRLKDHGGDVRRYLRDLEEVVIRVLGRWDLPGRRRDGLTGAWVGDEKVAAIGVALRRWVTYHGFAINASADLSGFEQIVPCGIRDYDVTSISRLCGRDVTVEELKGPVVECAGEVFGFGNIDEQHATQSLRETENK